MEQFWVYLLVVFLVAVNGEIAILLAAGAASAGYLNPYGVFFAAAAGNILSDVLWYSVGYFSKIDWLFKRFRWMGITPDQVEAAGKLIRKDALRLLIFSKLTNWLTIPALIATGAAKAPWKRWFWVIILSDIVIAIIFTPLGYFMTSSLLKIENGLRFVAMGFTLIMIVVSFYFFRKYLRGKVFLAPKDTLHEDIGN